MGVGKVENGRQVFVWAEVNTFVHKLVARKG